MFFVHLRLQCQPQFQFKGYRLCRRPLGRWVCWTRRGQMYTTTHRGSGIILSKDHQLCCVELCFVLFCCVVLCCVVLCCVVLWSVVVCCGVVCCGSLCCAVLCCVVLCCAVLWGAGPRVLSRTDTASSLMLEATWACV